MYKLFFIEVTKNCHPNPENTENNYEAKGVQDFSLFSIVSLLLSFYFFIFVGKYVHQAQNILPFFLYTDRVLDFKRSNMYLFKRFNYSNGTFPCDLQMLLLDFFMNNFICKFPFMSLLRTWMYVICSYSKKSVFDTKSFCLSTVVKYIQYLYQYNKQHALLGGHRVVILKN